MAKKVLVVANRTAADDALAAVVGRMAEEGATAFHLLVPAEPRGLSRVLNPDDASREDAEARLAAGVARLDAAAGGVPVTGHVGVPEPLAAIEDAVHAEPFDAVVISTLPRRVSRWLHLDLPHKIAGLGLPVTHVGADGSVLEIAPVGGRATA